MIANDILRKCVHCGFCTATCPTYVLLGNELDSPRGRIYLFRDLLESNSLPSEKLVLHTDRCLSCLSCMTTCPASVDYMHLVDNARARIEKTYTRPLSERLLRALLVWVLPNPKMFRLALIGARLVRPFAILMPGRLKGLLRMAPARIEPPSPMDKPQNVTGETTCKASSSSARSSAKSCMVNVSGSGRSSRPNPRRSGAIRRTLCSNSSNCGRHIV